MTYVEAIKQINWLLHLCEPVITGKAINKDKKRDKWIGFRRASHFSKNGNEFGMQK